MNNLISFV